MVPVATYRYSYFAVTLIFENRSIEEGTGPRERRCSTWTTGTGDARKGSASN